MRSVLVIGYVWPEPESSAAGARMMQLLEFFLAKGYSVTFATTAVKTPFMANLHSLDIKTVKIELNNPSFDHFIKALAPEVVLFDRFMMEEQFGWRVSEFCPKALKILDTEDLHFFRKARHSAFKSGIPVTPTLLWSNTAKREIASIYRCDLTLIISEVEMDLLRNTFGVPDNLLFYLPFMLEKPSAERIKKLPSYEHRRHFVSIGNFKHEPNSDAVLNLKQHIWPLIKQKIPEAEMHIYGAYPSPKVQQLHQAKTGFLIKGRADSAEEVLKNARVLLAPLRFGAGLKGKFTDAMQSGTPTVTTPLGAEGMHGNLNWNGAIADNAPAFAREATELYQKQIKWQEAQANGFKILSARFLRTELQKEFEQIIDGLKENLKKHREMNFTGAMLSFHSMNTTRYLSKYIEMKNKCEMLKDQG